MQTKGWRGPCRLYSCIRLYAVLCVCSEPTTEFIDCFTILYYRPCMGPNLFYTELAPEPVVSVIYLIFYQLPGVGKGDVLQKYQLNNGNMEFFVKF